MLVECAVWTLRGLLVCSSPARWMVCIHLSTLRPMDAERMTPWCGCDHGCKSVGYKKRTCTP